MDFFNWLFSNYNAQKELAGLRKQLADCQSKLDLCQFNDSFLEPSGTIDIHEMSSILMDKAPEADLHLADKDCPIYRKQDVIDFLGLDETDHILYLPEKHDCDDYAREAFCKGFPLVWTNLHALNWVIDETGTFWYIEPQQDLLAQNLESWQGWQVLFFLNI
jgi:hypothetical protein